jgi:hypothetical protein
LPGTGRGQGQFVVHQPVGIFRRQSGSTKLCRTRRLPSSPNTSLSRSCIVFPPICEWALQLLILAHTGGASGHLIRSRKRGLHGFDVGAVTIDEEEPAEHMAGQRVVVEGDRFREVIDLETPRGAPRRRCRPAKLLAASPRTAITHPQRDASRNPRTATTANERTSGFSGRS